MQLVLEHPEHFGRKMFELELRAVAQAAFPFEFIGGSSTKWQGEEFALLWERLLLGADDFGKCSSARAGEGDQVSIAGDIDSGSVVCFLNCS